MRLSEGQRSQETLTMAFIEKHAAHTGGPADLMLSDMTFKSSPAPQKAPQVLSHSRPPPPPLKNTASYLGLTPTCCRLLSADVTGGAATRERERLNYGNIRVRRR